MWSAPPEDAFAGVEDALGAPRRERIGVRVEPRAGPCPWVDTSPGGAAHPRESVGVHSLPAGLGSGTGKASAYGSGSSGGDQIPQRGGVAAVVGPAEPYRHALAEEGAPRHRELTVG